MQAFDPAAEHAPDAPAPTHAYAALTPDVVLDALASVDLWGDGRLNPHKDPLISQISLDETEKADLVAFLKTLTDRGFVSDPRFADPFAASR